jgi:flagellar export protein FliJ
VAFRFSLEPVLRLRASYERLERLRLLTIAALMARVREEILKAEREDAAARHLRAATLTQGALAAEIQVDVWAEKVRARRVSELKDRLGLLQREHAKQNRVYQFARRRREILDNLRDNQLREYRREQERRERQTLDELYLLRRFASFTDH